MCGILGVLERRGSREDLRHVLARGLRRMAARGPDGEGVWVDEAARVALGHRRLSIIDLSERGAQPMASADGKLVVSFNGEIYNYRELRQELERAGRSFVSGSDTEVLLHAYAVHGASMVEKLRGMFAFALWDGVRGGMLLARDPYGVKPLYYAADAERLVFGSQIKALIDTGVCREVDVGALAGFYALGSVPEPLTILRAAKALPAGSTLWADAHGVSEPRRYFSLAQMYQRGAEQAHDGRGAQERLREAVLDSVRHHMVADVPVGAFLSAGVDSGALVALMREVAGEGAGLRAITVAFDEMAGAHEDEAPLATLVARTYGVEHAVRRVSRAEVEADLPAFFGAMDQPTIDGLNTWLVSKAAREHGLKVAVSGLGGDELLGGYPSFRELPTWVRTLAPLGRVPLAGRTLRRVAAPLLARAGLTPKLGALLEHGHAWEGAYLARRGLFMPWELPALMGTDRAAEGLARLRLLERLHAPLEPDPGSDFARVACLEAALYMRNQLLRDTDWASMAHSLEVRVPLVDVALLTRCAPLARDAAPSKRDLALAPRKPLPQAITTRAKTGFGTPVGRWLEQGEALDAWRRVPLLHARGTHWARRYAYCVAQRYVGDSL